MKIVQNSNIGFLGYRNLVSHAINTPQQNIAYMLMELSNQKSFNDLKKFNEIKKELNIPIKPDNDKYLMITLFKHKSGDERIYLEREEIPTAEQLYKIKNQLPSSAFEYYEKSILRLYTLLANITKRIMNDNNIKKESLTEQTELVTEYMNRSGLFIESSPGTMCSFIKDTLRSEIPSQKIALFFNKIIDSRMIKYFSFK